jgi:pimeloyl-ACP methyl ester carboxylesterase
MFLHGLAGRGEEWADTASRLRRARVVAPDQRGHGRSERRPPAVSADALVDDAAFWLEELSLAPAAVAGQSFGGLVAFLLAARRPELVARLVVAEATPERDPGARARVAGWLAEWPGPFPTRDAAVAFFGDTLWGRTWAGGLERRPDGYRPAFETDVVLALIERAARRSYWDDWRAIRCPVLVVHGAAGTPRRDMERMLEAMPSARLVEIAGAGHDVHLDAPAAWCRTIEPFLAGYPP